MSGCVVAIIVLNNILGRDLGDLGRGERGGPEVRDAADYGDEQPGLGQPLMLRFSAQCK